MKTHRYILCTMGDNSYLSPQLWCFITNKQIVYCQSWRSQRSCIISTNLDTMIRLIYMISILIIYTSYFIFIIQNSHLSKVFGNVKNPYIIDQNPKHSELSIFWLFIYSLCCCEWFLFVHNLNTTNKNWKIMYK